MELSSLHQVGDAGHHLMHSGVCPHKLQLSFKQNIPSYICRKSAHSNIFWSISSYILLGVPRQKDNHNNVAIQLLLHMKHLRFINDNMHCIITFVNRLTITTDPFFITSIIMCYATFRPLLVDDAPTRTTKTC